MRGGAMAVDGLTLPHCAKGQATVTASGLRVRSLPSTTAAILGGLLAGQVVTVWAVDAGWAIVQAADGLTGWVSMDYLKRVGELTP